MMQVLHFDSVVIGGGAVGLACAVELSRSAGAQVLLLESHDRLGSETTARNSEVIHAGIYYEPDSLKERMCIEGKERLFAFCERYGVGHRRCGKLVVGSESADSQVLEKILNNAKRNSIPVSLLGKRQVNELEPEIRADIAVESPTTGIVCSEAYVQCLAQLAESQGVVISRRSRAVGWEKQGGDYVLQVQEPGDMKFQVRSPVVVNSAGLNALNIASSIFGPTPSFSLKYVRGHYFALSSKYKGVSSRLIYPIPDTQGGGLGIHLTLNLEGQASLGPDTDWRNTDTVDYAFHDADIAPLRDKFHQAALRYLPELQASDLTPSFVGVRPKLVDSNGKMLDFYIQEETARGYPGWVNLLGIESPGLTASLAIAGKVQKILVT